MSSKKIVAHFDAIARDYDRYKKMNWYYHSSIKNMLREFMGDLSGKSVLEIGCGTGDILRHLNPGVGVGIDASKNMVELARAKHGSRRIRFMAMDAEALAINRKFDFVVMVDVLEHLESVPAALSGIRRVSGKNTRVVITSANPLWTPALRAAEAIGLKMPEGPHRWITLDELSRISDESGFEMKENGYRLIIPVHVPVVAHFVNRVFCKIPIIRALGLVQYAILVAKN